MPRDQGPNFSENFFRRDRDGRVRPRITFSEEEAAMIEEAAGDTPLMLYIHRALKNRAEYHIRKRAQLAAAGQLDDDDDEDEARA